MQNHPHGARPLHHGRYQGTSLSLPALRHVAAPIHGAGHGFKPCAQGSPPIYAPRPTPHLIPLVLGIAPPVVPLPHARAVVACSFHPRARGETTINGKLWGSTSGIGIGTLLSVQCAHHLPPSERRGDRVAALAGVGYQQKPRKGLSHFSRLENIRHYPSLPATCRISCRASSLQAPSKIVSQATLTRFSGLIG